MNVLAAALLSVALSVAPAAPAAPRRVAVLDFTASWGSDCTALAKLPQAQREQCEALRLFADQARGGALAILRPPAFVVMTRENTAQILKDMGGQCSEGECEVETARLLGAAVVVSGEVTFMEGTWLVSMKVHDVTSAALLGTGDTEGKSKLEAFRNVRAETEKMLKAAVGLDGGAPTAAVPAPPSPQAPEVSTAGGSPPAAPSRRAIERVYGAFGLHPVGYYSHPNSGFDAQKNEPGFDGFAGYRLAEEWAAEAVFTTINPYFEGNSVPDGKVRRKCFGVGAAWWPNGNRYLSIAANLGVSTAIATISETSSPMESAPYFQASLRAEYPIGPVSLGAMASVVAAGSAAIRLSVVYTTTQTIGDGPTIAVPLGFTVKVRY